MLFFYLYQYKNMPCNVFKYKNKIFKQKSRRAHETSGGLRHIRNGCVFELEDYAPHSIGVMR